ncbi:MAG: DUF1512 domain-containing protein, partial [Candidatus Verstraetearchaeota archaeon]|nr:DUF1512 domain-containing protein [Candidatus Verstraetearchaeota archaeon]
FTVLFALIFFFNQRIQLWTYQRNVEKAAVKLEILAKRGRERLLEVVKQLGGGGEEKVKAIDNFLEFFAIEPVDKDPYGVLRRLEHILNLRKDRIRSFVTGITRDASKVQRYNLEGVMEAAIALNYIFRVVRHYLILGKKTRSLFILMQLDMQMPLIMKMAEAYFNALKAFSKGEPIGDGLGPLVAAKLMHGKEKKYVAEEVVASEFNLDGRRVIVLKAEGPGSSVGKPGEAVARLVEQHGGRIARIIMVDAAAKLEGEKTGDVVEGVGAAIGDPGPEKYKIEEAAVKWGIPIDAIIVKMGLDEALSTMKKEIVDAADEVVERIKKIVAERVKEGEVVIVAGIGNTIGIGQ